MTAPHQKHSQTLARLNATPLSRHVSTILDKHGIPNPPDSLALINLLAWASTDHYQDLIQGEMELGAAVRAASEDPEAVYDNLADDRMLDETTPTGLAEVLVSQMSDLLDGRSLPAR